MSDRQLEETARRNETAGVHESYDHGRALTWHQIVEWSDEDLARWRDAHKRPKSEPVS